jgi:hypothetical protein
MSYTVWMVRFEQDGTVPTRRLDSSFTTPEAAFTAGARAVAADTDARGFQICGSDGKAAFLVKDESKGT